MLEGERLREKGERLRGVWKGVARTGEGPPRRLKNPVEFISWAPADSLRQLRLGRQRGFPTAADARVGEMELAEEGA